MKKKAWGGRFEENTNELALRFSASVDTDKRLANEDIRGSIAHVEMLARCGIVGRQDAERISLCLKEIATEIERGEFPWDPQKEDVHMNIEAELTRRVGEAGGRLHTARSRNDQVATDMRLWTKTRCEQTIEALDHLLSTLCVLAAKNLDVLLPGYTHLQRAQPVRLAHHLLAWAEMLERDRGRLADAAHRMNECPLGSGALSTTTFPIDRHYTSQALGFRAPTANSLDTVGDRDFLVEAVAALANCAVHLSRISEELVLWSTQEFGFIEMSDSFTTGSSMMPQKKNPDMAELVRGKTGRVVGSLVTLLMLLKGLPLSYNRDLQEDKAPVFDAFDTVLDCLAVLEGALRTAYFHTDRMRRGLLDGFVEATELADYLAAKGVPFREAHHVVGRIVRRCVNAGKRLPELSLTEFREEHPAFDEAVYEVMDLDHMVERRQVYGGPGRKMVLEQLIQWREKLSERSRDTSLLDASLSDIQSAGSRRGPS